MKYAVITRAAGKIVGRNIIDLSAADHAMLTAFASFMNKELARSQSTRHVRTSTFTPMEQALSLKIVTSDFVDHESVWSLFQHIDYNHETEEYV